jgi:hypothetical protein
MSLSLAQIDTFETNSLKSGYLPISPETCVVSYPRSGRTWLKYMLFYVQIKMGLIKNSCFSIFKHDGVLIHRISRMRQYRADKSMYYKKRRVLLLVRDPRDVLVSAYHFIRHNRSAMWIRHMDIEDYIRFKYGLPFLIRFMNDWATQQHVPKEFMMVRYADLVNKCKTTLRSIVKYLAHIDVQDNVLNDTVNACRFERMQMHCRKVASDGISHQSVNNECLPARRGVIGGYVDYLGQKDIDWIDSQLRRSLHPKYGFYIK